MTAIKAEPSREAAIIAERHPGPFIGADAELARACAMVTIPDYGNDDPDTHQRIMQNGIWNDHIAVQAALTAIHSIRKAAALRAPAGDAGVREPRWVSPIKTVGDLVSSLLTLDQAMEVHGAYHITSTEDRCRARGLSLSLEHVINNRIKPDKTIPHSLVVWTAPSRG